MTHVKHVFTFLIHYWQITVYNMKIDKGRFVRCKRKVCDVIADAGGCHIDDLQLLYPLPAVHDVNTFCNCLCIGMQYVTLAEAFTLPVASS